MFVAYLWPEYQYPHDMVWRLVFRITAVAAALLIAPFLTDQSVQRAVGYWGLLALPLLGLVVLGGGFFTLQSELHRLDAIRNAYRQVQGRVLNAYVKRDESEQGAETFDFNRRVTAYLVLLFLGAAVYVLVLGVYWLDELVDEARKAKTGSSGPTWPVAPVNGA